MIDFLSIVKALLAVCEKHDEECHGHDFTPSWIINQARELIQQEEERRACKETYEQLHE